MTCQDARAQLHPYCDGTLAREQVRLVDRHLSECVECRAARDRIRSMEHLLETAGVVPEPSAEFWAEQKKKLLERGDRPAIAARPPVERHRLPSRFWASLATAGLAAAVLIAFALHRTTPPPVENPPSPPVGKKSEAPKIVPRVEVPAPPSPEKTPKRTYLPSPPLEPTPLPELPPEKAVADALPGDPGHFEQMTDEALAIGLAETPSERVGTFFRAADARLAELRTVFSKDAGLAEELASAYAILLREGVAVVLAEREEDAEEMERARRIARVRAGRNEKTLAELQTSAGGRLKETIGDAMLASRELARR